MEKSNNIRRLVTKVRKTVAKLCFAMLMITIMSMTTIKVVNLNNKVFSTQVELAFIADDIRLYNQTDIKTDHDTQMAEKLFERRRAINHSEDPVIAWAARYGFSFIIFFGSLAVYVGLAFLWYIAIKNHEKILWVLPTCIAIAMFILARLFLDISSLYGRPVVLSTNKRAGSVRRQQNTKDKRKNVG